MTDATTLLALAERAPAMAAFDVGQYSDGSGPVAQVSYDTRHDPTSSRVWIETSSEKWVAVDAEYAADLCAAIMSAAKAIIALRAQAGEG